MYGFFFYSDKGKLQMKLSGHTETIDMIGVPDGQLLMSYSRVGEENLMRIWDVNTWECVASYRPEDVVSDQLFPF